MVMMIHDNEVREEGRIMGFVEACRDDGKDDKTIISRLISKYSLTQTEAEKYVLPVSSI